jgi:hypothetical protein
MIRYPSGWQQDPGTGSWHFFPGHSFQRLSACERMWREASIAPVAEPVGAILCQRCIRNMVTIAAELEWIRTHGPPDLPPGLH